MKRKIVALVAIIMMVSLSFGTVHAREERKQETIEVLFEAIGEDGSVEYESLTLTEEELTIFQSQISQIIQSIKDITDISQLIEMLKNLFGSNSQLLSTVLKLFKRPGLLKNRALIISQGPNHDLNPLRRTRFKIRKKFTFWRYGEGIGASTLILKPLRLKFERLSGPQFGFMHKFMGLYIHISRRISQNSYTFFMGTAKNAFGVDFTP